MRLYATRRQCEQIIIALMEKFSNDEDALKQCKKTKTNKKKEG